MKKINFFLLLLFLPFLIKAQDTLVLKDGRSIICKISNTNDLQVFFEISKNGRTVETLVNKIEIQEIKYHKPKPVSAFKRNDFGITVGFSVPTGDFANSDIYDEDAGLADGGKNFSAIFNYHHSNIGFRIKAFYNTNKLKTDKLAELMESMVHISVSNSSSYYISKGFLMGPVFYLPIEKVSINGNILLGFANLTQQSATFSFPSGSYTGWIKMNEVNRADFIYNIGGGFTIDLDEKWNFLLNVDYIQGSFNFGKLKMTASNGYIEETDRGTQNFGVFAISTGLSVKF